MTDIHPRVPPDNSKFEQISWQARRYMETVYGKSVWFRAPETFENVLERWIWALASDAPEMAEECMARIEEMASARRKDITS
jgi:hypothetical protein